MSKKVVIITGANSGIGLAASKRFATEGFHVIMGCRNLIRGNRARLGVLAESGSSSVEVIEIDISSNGSIKSFVEQVSEKHHCIDILIHNAAYFEHGTKGYQFNDDRVELTFATNVFGPLYLTELLRPLMRNADDPRIINAGSTSLKNFFDPKRDIEFDNMRGEYLDSRPYSVFRRYAESKMALLLLTYKMAEVYRTDKITANCLMIPTTKISGDAIRKMKGIYRIIGPIVQNWNPFSLEQEVIADCYFQMAMKPEFRTLNGELFDYKLRVLSRPENEVVMNPISIARQLFKPTQSPPYTANRQNAETLWSLAKEIIPAN